MSLVIRADGGPDIGFGHLNRSNSLVEEMLKKDVEITVTTTTPEAALSVFREAVKIVELPSRCDPKPFLEWLDSNRSDAVFTDAYPVDTRYQRAIRNQVPLAVFQDDNRHAVCADLFMNSNIYAENMEYEFIDEEPTKCLGTDYVLLRSDIRDRAKEKPQFRDFPERALVTMGGSDTSNLTPAVLRSFNEVDIYIDAIVGPGFSIEQEQDIRGVAQEISPEVEVVVDPDDLATRMFEADFAVCTSSSTIYELLALGTPIITCAVANNQKLIAEALQESNLATMVDSDGGVEAFRVAIEQYISNSDLRRYRQKRGRKLVDCNGARRTCAKVLSLVD